MDHSISSGSLRTKISLKGGYSQLSLVVPFYGMKQELPPPSTLLGSDDLISHFDLGSSYNRYCGSSKKLRDDLASFLPQVCGTSNLSSTNDASCSLRKLVEKPPITGKEVAPLSASAMVGFKLAPGPVPENYRFFDMTDGLSQELSAIGVQEPSSSNYQEFGKNFNDAEEVKEKHRKKMKRSLDELEDNERKIKKHRSEEKDKEKEKEKKQKKKKKEKKKKKTMDEEAKRSHRKESAPFF